MIKMDAYYKSQNGALYCGDVLETLKKLPEKSVNMCITSPPYWALRDYGIEGQLGLEPTFEEYIDRLCGVFDEVKRVLRDDGTCWINLGDTYGGASSRASNGGRSGYGTKREGVFCRGIDKSLVGIPDRFKIEMINRGWICRNEIIWHKPNCMPDSTTDRFTVDFEKIFFFSKNKNYYFEQQIEANFDTYNGKRGKNTQRTKLQSAMRTEGFSDYYGKGRNKRTVWKIPTKAYSGAHFAIYPEKLLHTPIKAGCPKEVCRECGCPKELKIKTKRLRRDELSKDDPRYRPNRYDGSYKNINGKGDAGYAERTVEGYQPTCDCNAGFESGTVLDIFMGSGTTGLVAEKLNRKWTGIDLNEEYCEIAKQRIKKEADQGKLF